MEHRSHSNGRRAPSAPAPAHVENSPAPLLRVRSRDTRVQQKSATILYIPSDKIFSRLQNMFDIYLQ